MLDITQIVSCKIQASSPILKIGSLNGGGKEK